MKLPPYPKYTASGLEWVGDIPEHWRVTSIFRQASEIQTGPFGSQLHEKDYVEGGVPVLNPIHIVGKSFEPDESSAVDEVTANRLARHRLRAGDILVARRGEIGRCAVATPIQEGWLCGTGSMILRMPHADPRYVARVMSGKDFRRSLELRAVGSTMPNLNPGIVGRMVIPFPPLSEQTLIADFVERSSAKIDLLIAKKRTLIERLKEKRTALISRTVISGLPAEAALDTDLDPDPRRKRSGIAWLGELPEHWRIRPLKLAAKFIEGPGIMAADFEEEGVPLLRISGLLSRWARLDGCNFLNPESVAARWSHFRVKSGDLLISGSASTGLCAEVDELTEGAIPYTGIIIVRPREGSIASFLRWFFASQAFEHQIDMAKSGSTIQHFGPTHLARMRIASPPESEQVAIAAFLDDHVGRLDRMVQTIELAIARLLEYRTALITAAVTGKIDVRNAVPAARVAS